MGRKLALVLEYDGTAYHGFQVQANAPTIQGNLEKALARLTGEAIRVVGAGRTDAGAHARGQVVSFCTESGLPLTALVRGLNTFLPQDIAVRAGREVGEEFDARRSALSRWYRYTLLRQPVPSAFERRWSYWVPAPLDLAAISAACQALAGRHDFAAFTTPAFGPAGTVREMFRAQVVQRSPLVHLDLEATAFLPQQVRRTVLALLQVGAGRLTVERFADLLRSPRLGAVASGVPARGLCLMAVRYPPPYGDLVP